MSSIDKSYLIDWSLYLYSLGQNPYTDRCFLYHPIINRYLQE